MLPRHSRILKSMIPSANLITEYRGAYRKKFGEDISTQEAVEQMTNLANLLILLYGSGWNPYFKEFDKSRQDVNLNS